MCDTKVLRLRQKVAYFIQVCLGLSMLGLIAYVYLEWLWDFIQSGL